MQIEYHVRCFLNEQLTDEEKIFKEHYIKQKSIFEGNFSAVDFLTHVSENEREMLRFCIPTMEETHFFPTPEDVNVVPHGRYTPAFVHKHGFIEMIYVFSGTCINHIQNREVQMHAGDVGIVAPGTEHSIRVFSDECIVYNYLIRMSTFEKTFFSILSTNSVLSDFFKKVLGGYRDNQSEKDDLAFADSFLMFRTGIDDALRIILMRIFEESRNHAHYKMEMMDALLTLFFVDLMRNHEKDLYIEGEDVKDNQMLIPIFRFMQDNYKSVSLSGMAKHFHYSERHMKRVIKKYTGYSFSENILRIRMVQAGQLLEKTGMSVADVAEAVGYSDVSSFRYAFRKYYQMSPKDYRGKRM